MEPAALTAPTTQAGAPRAITEDLAYLQTAIANVVFYGSPRAEDQGWTLIDTGVFGFARRIKTAAGLRFGAEARPNAIVLTHGHFDHVGAARQLAGAWDVPIFAHPLELPYLSGQSAYPPGDSTVGGGVMAALAWLYPNGPVDLRPRIQPLPPDGSVPGMPGWRWIHTPGHSPGHVALFREEDRALISGDAVITVKQESALSVLRQTPEMHGPPAYFTPDWVTAGRSVQALADLDPDLIVSGHGEPMRGPAMAGAIRELAEDFSRVAVPRYGRYAENAAVTNTEGLVWAPPSRLGSSKPLLLALGAASLATIWLASRNRA